MLNKNMVVDLLKAVATGSKDSIKKLQTNHGDAYVLGMYWLYERGLVTTPRNNFVYGGDRDKPLDMHDYVGVHLTAKGRILLARL